jgi:hypothetical protein
MTAPPPDPKKPLTGAILWLVVTAIVTAFMFFRAAENEEKRTFYLVMGVVGVIATTVNAHSAWQAYRQQKSPPGV